MGRGTEKICYPKKKGIIIIIIKIYEINNISDVTCSYTLGVGTTSNV